MATDEGMVESDEYQDWIDVYGEEPRRTGGSKRHNHQHGQPAMPGICPSCNYFAGPCSRPGTLSCDEYSAQQA